MPKVDKIAITYERKLNMGNYQSATVGVTAWVDVLEGEDANNVIAYTQQQCRWHAEQEARRLIAPAPVAINSEIKQS